MIIQSRLDNDFYQFTMSQLIHELWPTEQVRYEFRNRTFSVPLAQRISLNTLKNEIEQVRALSFTKPEINWLRNTGMFSHGYLNWLELSHKLPPVEVSMVDGHLRMEYEGDWRDGVFWETILLSLVSELYHQEYNVLQKEGLLRLNEKVKYLKEHPQLQFVEFGTRRRWSAEWQEQVTAILANHCDNMVGTSNVQLAMTYDMAPVGTMAHQLFMVRVAMADPQDTTGLIDTQCELMSQWFLRYQDFPQLLTLLPDTYGTELLLAGCDPEDLYPFKAVRQDSGDPFKVGETILHLYEEKGAPAPTLIFSDGLDLRTMNLLHDRFGERTTVKFGWGTNLTNDLGFESLSLVIKPKSVNGAPCVKLSDNIAKATGDPKEIERYKMLAAYDGSPGITPKY